MRGWWLTATLFVATAARAQQTADDDFDARVARPAYVDAHPTVAIDEAHANFHTAAGRYKPLADLLSGDGYRVVRGTAPFARAGLAGVAVLIVANAGVGDAPAFTERECDAVRDWVRGGGALLLIADHSPYGAAAAGLAARFGVDMGKGFAFDTTSSDGHPTVLVFSRDNGLLGDHPVMRGRGAGEEVRRVVAFTGQSLGVPAGATAILRLGAHAREAPTREDVAAALAADAASGGRARAVAGRAQGVVFPFGKGRVAVFGEAAMFSAQVVRFTDGGRPEEFRMGMNVPGNDDRQLALNVLHWLSGLLP
jgi:hypothetical protein